MCVTKKVKIVKVAYHSHQLCKGGGWRRTFWYRCRKKGVKEGSAEHHQSREEARKAAWRHIEEVAKLGGDAEKVIPQHGKGELVGGRGIRYHGDVHEEQRFHVYPKGSFDFFNKGVVRWRPDRDTFDSPRECWSQHQESCGGSSSGGG